MIVIGDAHNHQVADYFDAKDPGNTGREASSQSAGDGKAAIKTGLPAFTIDSKNVDAHIPKTGPMGKYAAPVNNIANTQDLYNNNFSILRTALEYFGGKR